MFITEKEASIVLTYGTSVFLPDSYEILLKFNRADLSTSRAFMSKLLNNLNAIAPFQSRKSPDIHLFKTNHRLTWFYPDIYVFLERDEDQNPQRMRLFHGVGEPIELKITSYPIKNKRLLNGRVAYLLNPINGYKVFCIDIIKKSYYLEDEKGNKTHFQQVPLEANISFLEKKGITIEPNYPRMIPLKILKIANLLPINDSMSPLPKG